MNQPYDIARYRAATGALNWPALDLRLVAFHGTPVFSAAAATIQQVIDLGGVVKAGHSLTALAKSVDSQGYCKTGPIVFDSTTAAVTLTMFVLAIHNATENLSIPLLYIDTGMNIPFDTDGLELVLQPDWAFERGWVRF